MSPSAGAGDDLYDLSTRKVARISSVAFFLVSQLKFQLEYLSSLGIQVVAISGNGKELEKLAYGPNLRHLVVEFGRMLDPLKDIVAITKLWLFLRRERFDITHSTTPKAGLITAIAAYFAGVPVRLHTFTGQPWVNLRGPIKWFARLSDRIIGLLCTRCYADSPSQCAFLITEGLIQKSKIKVIGQGSLAGVDLKRFDPHKWSLEERRAVREEIGISPASRVFIFIGRIARDKGIAELLVAFERLISHGYDTDLLLVGPLDEECGGAGFLSAAELRTHRRVHYVGYSATPERYLAVSDILCLPSYREGFGTVVIEAAAMGLPTVGTRINGLVDAVVDGATGLLVKVKDAAALSAACAHLLDHPERLLAMGRAARERCTQDFDAKVVNAKVAEEYVDLLAQRYR
jgi:glycosyltransferase involved in cell wall biosynthesis